MIGPATAATRRQLADLERRALAAAASPSVTLPDRCEAWQFQTGHGLEVGDVVRHNGTGWVKAKADTPANAAAAGIVSQVAGAAFAIAFSGLTTGLAGLTPGAVHYLDPTTDGELTTTAPTLAVPILRALSATVAIVLPQLAVTGTPPPSDILADSATVSDGGSLVLTPAASIPYGRRVDIHIASARAVSYGGPLLSAHTHHVSLVKPSSGGALVQKWASAGVSWAYDASAYGGNNGREVYQTGTYTTVSSDLTVSLTTDATGYSSISIDFSGTGGAYLPSGNVYAVARY